MKKNPSAFFALVLSIIICGCVPAYYDSESQADPDGEKESIFARLSNIDIDEFEYGKIYELSMSADGCEITHISRNAGWMAEDINVYYRAVPDKYKKNGLVLVEEPDETEAGGKTYYIESYNLHVDSAVKGGSRNYRRKKFSYLEGDMDYSLIYSSESDDGAYGITIEEAIKAFDDFAKNAGSLENYSEYWHVGLRREDDILIKIYPYGYGRETLAGFLDEEATETIANDGIEYYFATKIMPNPEFTRETLMVETGIGIFELTASISSIKEKEQECGNRIVNIEIVQEILEELAGMQ